MEKKKVIVIGYGYVGKAMVSMLKSHYYVYIYDPAYLPEEWNNKIKFPNSFGLDAESTQFIRENEIEELSKDCTLNVICVSTPRSDDGSCDISAVEWAIPKLQGPILIKSTIEVGTTDMLKQKYQKRIVFSPEYIGESKYWQPYSQTNMKEVPMLIVGGDKEDTQYIIDVLAPIMGPVKNYYQTSAKVAEMTKYMENTFYALKVTFCNEMFGICEKAGIDYWDVREAWLLDPRINKMHTCVFRNHRGFGGKCFPKDVNAIVKYAEKIGYSPDLLKEVLNSNDKFRSLNKEQLD
jgi:UDPglucose 6-dehydrogenase